MQSIHNYYHILNKHKATVSQFFGNTNDDTSSLAPTNGNTNKDAALSQKQPQVMQESSVSERLSNQHQYQTLSNKHSTAGQGIEEYSALRGSVNQIIGHHHRQTDYSNQYSTVKRHQHVMHQNGERNNE